MTPSADPILALLRRALREAETSTPGAVRRTLSEAIDCRLRETPTPVTPRPSPPPPPPDDPPDATTAPPGFVLDAFGHLWSWNCGWTSPTVPGRRLSHRQFSARPKATRRDIHEANVRFIKPGRLFRRHLTNRATPGLPIAYSHPLYGRVNVLATDGIRAIVRPFDADDTAPTYTVIYANLTELRDAECTPRAPRRVSRKQTLLERAMALDIDALL